jgi:hypothetical protein
VSSGFSKMIEQELREASPLFAVLLRRSTLAPGNRRRRRGSKKPLIEDGNVIVKTWRIAIPVL